MKNVKFSISIFLGLYLLLAVIFMIVPLNSFLLDVLITFNIAIAMIILFLKKIMKYIAIKTLELIKLVKVLENKKAININKIILILL